MTIAQGATNTFKVGLMDGNYNLAGGSFNIALYTGAASIGPDTTMYTSTGEVPDGNGYTAGGQGLTISQAPTIGTQTGVATVYMSFDDVSWTGVITARGALIYDANTLASVCVLDFGADKTSTTTFTVQFPAVTNTSAIIRMT